MTGRKLVASLAIVLTLTAPAMAFRNFNVPSSSMMPTLGPGDVVTAALYGLDYDAMLRGEALRPSEDPRFQPRRGDVAFFTAGEGEVWVARIMGVGGDRLQMLDGILHLNGAPLASVAVGAVPGACADGDACDFLRETLPGAGGSHVVMSVDADSMGDDTAEFTVPVGHYFLMGDNRDNAADSRFGVEGYGMVGYVPRGALIGRLHAILYSPRAEPSFRERIDGFPSLR